MGRGVQNRKVLPGSRSPQPPWTDSRRPATRRPGREVVLPLASSRLSCRMGAYLAWHCWRWGEERNEMFGTLADGYIVVPKAAGVAHEERAK
jgi:predicted RNase H-like nuclease